MACAALSQLVDILSLAKPAVSAVNRVSLIRFLWDEVIGNDSALAWRKPGESTFCGWLTGSLLLHHWTATGLLTRIGRLYRALQAVVGPAIGTNQDNAERLLSLAGRNLWPACRSQ